MTGFDLSGQVVVVTGATAGIGRRLVDQLIADGAHVVAVGRSADALAELASQHGKNISVFQADLSGAGEVDRLIAEIGERHPSIAALINNAAMQTEMDFLAPAAVGLADGIRREIAANLAAPLVLSAGLLPLLAMREKAVIVNVTSALAVVPKAAAPVYCATKAGLRTFTRALRYQCEARAPHVRVVEVVMTLVDTGMTRGRGRGKIAPEAAAEAVRRAIRSGRGEVWLGKTRLLRLLHALAPPLAYRMLRWS